MEVLSKNISIEESISFKNNSATRLMIKLTVLFLCIALGAFTMLIFLMNSSAFADDAKWSTYKNRYLSYFSHYQESEQSINLSVNELLKNKNLYNENKSLRHKDTADG